FQYPAHHPPPALLFSRPFSYGLYILGYAGAGLGFWRPLVAIAWGSVGLTAFAWCGIWLWTRSAAHRRSVLPWLLLALYALLSGMVTGIGRSGFGKAQALSSRYTTISSLFWVSVIVVVALAVAEALKAATMSRPREWTTVAVATFFVTLAGVSLGVSWAHAQIDILDQHAAHIKNAECVLYYD